MNKLKKCVSILLLVIPVSTIFTTTAILNPLVTPTAHAANWLDRLPVPTGAFIDLGYNKYYYGDLNDLSQIVQGVTWQIQHCPAPPAPPSRCSAGSLQSSGLNTSSTPACCEACRRCVRPVAF